MHKKLEAELVSLAHSILQMKNKDDVTALHKKAHDIYEKLSVLKFVDAYITTTPQATESKEEIISNIEDILTNEMDDTAIEVDSKEENIIFEKKEVENEKKVHQVVEETISEEVEVKKQVEEKPIMLTDDQVEAIFGTKDGMIKDEEQNLREHQFTLEDELKDAISSDVATQLFEKATKENPVIEEQVEKKKKSLNDAIFTDNIQVGLNDRIAFVKHLFDGSQEDFNRVLSQLNSFKTEEEAKDFIIKFVKPDYNWEQKLEYEDRLIDLIERKFL